MWHASTQNNITNILSSIFKKGVEKQASERVHIVVMTGTSDDVSYKAL